MTPERLTITLLLLGLLALLPLLARSVQSISRRRAEQAASRRPDLAGGRPTIVYFWSTDCHQCRVAQAPTLQRLVAETDVALVSVDAVADRSLADSFGVLTVPTTVVLDHLGAVRAVNHGFAPLAALRAQLSAERAA